MVQKRKNEAQAVAVLCSAGLDSAVLLADAVSKARAVPIYVATGLAWEAAEQQALERLLKAAPYLGRVADLVTLHVDMRDVYPSTHWAIRGNAPASDTPDEDVYLTGRNLVLLTKAGVHCAQHDISRIAIGTLAGMVIDRMRFDGQRATVLGRYEQALQEWQTYRIALEKASDGHDGQSSCR